jgi:hypothetical protein
MASRRVALAKAQKARIGSGGNGGEEREMTSGGIKPWRQHRKRQKTSAMAQQRGMVSALTKQPRIW